MAYMAIGVSSGGNTNGNTGTVFGTYVLQGGNNITLSQATGASGTHTVVVSGPNLATVSQFYLGNMMPFAAQSSGSLGQNSVFFWPVNFPFNVSANCVKFPAMLTNSSSATASAQKGQTINFGIYTRNATNSTVLTQHYSTSYTIAASHNSNVSWMLSMITAVNNSTSYLTINTSSGGLGLSASMHGAREFIMPISSNFTPGEYWMALRNSTSSAGAPGAILNISNMLATFQTFNVLNVGVKSNTNGVFEDIGLGAYSVTTGALPNSLSMSEINLIGSIPIGYIVPTTK